MYCPLSEADSTATRIVPFSIVLPQEMHSARDVGDNSAYGYVEGFSVLPDASIVLSNSFLSGTSTSVTSSACFNTDGFFFAAHGKWCQLNVVSPGANALFTSSPT